MTSAAPDPAALASAAADSAVTDPAAPDWPRNAAEMLFGPSADAPEALTRHILSTGDDLEYALKRLTRKVRRAAVREAAVAAAGLLKVDLLGVLVSGWREHKEITAAARRTLTMLSSRELVSLPPHRIATAQQPSVGILVDGKRVASLRLGLAIIFDVEGLVAGITSGRLSVVHAGRCAVGVTLTVHDIETLTKRAHLELPGAFGLGTGVRLLPGHEYPVGVPPGAESPGSVTDAPLMGARIPRSEFPAAPLAAGGPKAGRPSDPAPAEHTISDYGTAHPSAANQPPWWDNLQDASG
jgi:hypothetical protein